MPYLSFVFSFSHFPGTATILNELYYDLSAMENGGCPPPTSSSTPTTNNPSLKSPSFSCSGMFYHGIDPWAGKGPYGGEPMPLPGKYRAVNSSNFSTVCCLVVCYYSVPLLPFELLFRDQVFNFVVDNTFFNLFSSILFFSPRTILR